MLAGFAGAVDVASVPVGAGVLLPLPEGPWVFFAPDWMVRGVNLAGDARCPGGQDGHVGADLGDDRLGAGRSDAGDFQQARIQGYPAGMPRIRGRGDQLGLGLLAALLLSARSEGPARIEGPALLAGQREGCRERAGPTQDRAGRDLASAVPVGGHGNR